MFDLSTALALPPSFAITTFRDGDPGVPEGPPGNSVPERPTDPEEDADLIESQALWPIYPDDLG